MSNYTTGMDLIAAALESAGESSTGSSRLHDKAVELLNEAYRSLCLGGREWGRVQNPNWWWLKSDAVITLEPDVTTGTVAVTQNSTSATFSSAPSASLAGWFVKFDLNADAYQIDSHTGGGTAITLDAPFTGDTDGAANYTVYRLDFDLASDVLRLMDPMEGFQNGRREIGLLDNYKFREMWPTNTVRNGTPVNFMMVDDDTVRFSHSGGSEYVQVRYSYLKAPDALEDSASSVPLVPLFYRKILADMTTSWLLTGKDDARNEEYGAMAMAGLRSMLAENSRRWNEWNRQLLIKPRQGKGGRYIKTVSGLTMRI